ncbi:MAG TPA: hypothetical protein GX405_07685 [Rhizobiales bacterium]|nr:hypothetical protein [Hyphomicrobiales bacterium]
MDTDLFITALVSMMTNAVLFGAGAITVLSIPALDQHAKYLLPAVILASLVLAPVAGWYIAPRLRARNWRYPPTAAA